MSDRFEYATIEWLWDGNSIRCDLPGGQVINRSGQHDEIVTLLNELGQQGWEVVTSTAQGNWIFWTLKRTQTGW